MNLIKFKIFLHSTIYVTAIIKNDLNFYKRIFIKLYRIEYEICDRKYTYAETDNNSSHYDPL